MKLNTNISVENVVTIFTMICAIILAFGFMQYDIDAIKRDLKFKADKEYDGDLMALYNDLYEGKTIEFDLLAVRPKFQLCKNMTIISRTSFKRKVSVK